MSGGELLGRDQLEGLSRGDVARWSAAFAVVLAAGWAVSGLSAKLVPEPVSLGEPEPTILLDLAPAPLVEAAVPLETETLDDLQPETVNETMSPQAAEVPISTETVQPVSPADATLAADAPPIAPVTPNIVTQEQIDASEPLEPQTVEPEPPQQAFDSAEVIPSLPALANAQVEPVEPESVAPAETLPEVLEPDPDAPIPATLPPRLRERREDAPPTPRRQPPAPQPAVTQPAESRAPRAAPATPSTPRSGSSVSPAQWQSQALRQLDRRKIYPNAASSRGVEGTAVITFAVNGNGQITSVSLARSSGSPVLDQAALDTARRASPLPPPPADLVGRALSANIRFSLQ